MSDWKLAMAAILPLMWRGRFRSVGAFLWSPKVRTWCAMFLASMSAWLHPGDPFLYLAIDVLAAAIVLAFPAGIAQRCVGALFGVMASFDIGFIIGGRNDPLGYSQALALAGWAQWAVLLSWGGYDLARPYRRRLWRGRPALDRGAGAGD